MKFNEETFKHIFIILILVVIAMSALWLIDVSVATMNMNGVLVNFFGMDPIKGYHIGLYVLTAIILLFATMYAWVILHG